MKMDEISLQDPGVIEACLDAFSRSPVLMVQFPEVFGLMALPTIDGIKGLHQTKQRLPGKYYGSVIGDSARFFSMENPEDKPEYLSSPEEIQKLEGSIIRIKIGNQESSNGVCHRGSHQGLLYRPSPIRSLFTRLEAAFEPSADKDLFLGHFYTAPLCTSANLSGHPDGSITRLDVAREFGKNAGIPLLIRCTRESAGAKGSFPVFSLGKSGIIIERDGPGLSEIISRFPAGLFSYR